MIDLEITDGVAFITLNAPATRNALNNELAGQFVAACDEADRDQQVGAAVIKGAGGTFCSGAERGHLDEVGRDPAEENRYAALGGIYRAFTRVGQMEMPTIAAVRGAAVGAGINLMLATDLRVVAEDARLISGFLRIRLHPGGGALGLRAGRAGAEAAAAAGIFGEEISGLRAAQLGLAWEALPSEQVEARAAGLGRRAARDPRVGRTAPRGRPAPGGGRGGPGPACAPSGARRGCRGRPPSRWSGALSSGRCAAGSPNSQSGCMRRCRHYPCHIERVNSLKFRCIYAVMLPPLQYGAYTPSSRPHSNQAGSAGYNIFAVLGEVQVP